MKSFLSPAKTTGHGLKVIACGPRRQAYKGFLNALQNPGPREIAILLVDSERKVSQSPRAHLSDKQHDNWDLRGTDDAAIHLMAQVMETWIVADRAALGRQYGHKFNLNALPKHTNLEEVSKKEVIDALEAATKRTQKGPYHKIKHASKLLESLDAETLQERCSHCKRLFETLNRIPTGAHA